MIDDHGLFRESLGRLLEATSELRIVARCANSSEALDQLSRVTADVLLLDYDLGNETALPLLKELKRRWKELRVLMVTAGLSDDVTLQLMEAGAAGVFRKHDNPEQLVTAIRRVDAGEFWLDEATLKSLLIGRNARNDSIERTRPLTDRQSAVLGGILDGLANKEIASKLSLSETSVKAVIQELFRKAGVRTRSQLVRIAIEKHSSDWLESRS
jgi:two-component system nitrate/nitrite response regulator NarL